MARKSTGNVRKHASGYSARIRIGPDDRPSFAIAAGNDHAGDQRAELMDRATENLRISP